MRLIDADRALEIVRDQGIAHPNAYHLTNYATLILREAPTIEAEPLRHGRWVIEKRHTVLRNPYIDDNYFASATCSECDFCIHAETKSFGYPDLNTTNYCPNCGARMDGDSHD